MGSNLGRIAIIGGVLASLAVTGSLLRIANAARYRFPYQPRLERITLPLPPGHAGLAGMKIGFVTDTHVGPFISPDDLDHALDLVRDARPDLLLLGGDYVSESPRYLRNTAKRLGALAATVPLGAFAVMGNHDYSISGQYAIDALAGVGIPVLRNAVVEVPFGGDALWIAGIDDSLLGRPDPQGTVAQAPAGAAVLALWHEPDFADEVAATGAFAQLSGHTHGGQVRLPVLGPVSLPVHGRNQVAGMNRVGGMPVYTSRGVGVYRPPVRLNCPPEVTLVTLVANERPVAISGASR